jgi:Domain of unknown function (DUF4203)
MELSEWSDFVIGVILLIFGRSLFWLFIGLAGYLFGVEFARIAFVEQPQWMVLLTAVATGLVGALLAIVAERLAFALGGFYGGAYLGVLISHWLGSNAHDVIFVIGGGALGAILAVLIMDWTIIFLSSLVGAGAITMALKLPPAWSGLLYAGLVIVGALIQSRIMNPSKNAGLPRP